MTSAHSVGSPTASPSVSSASEQSAMARASSASSSPKLSTTVILFCVSVPVLSVQMTCAQPSVSTAVRRRITAPRLDMAVTPIERTMVTTAASPSGTAATARLTASINASRAPEKPPERIMLTANMTALMPSTRNVSISESPESFF